MLMIRIHFQCMGFLCCVFIMNCVVTGQTYFHKIQCMQLVNLEVPYVKNVFPLETCGYVLSWTCMPEERRMERGSSQQLLERTVIGQMNTGTISKAT